MFNDYEPRLLLGQGNYFDLLHQYACLHAMLTKMLMKGHTIQIFIPLTRSTGSSKSSEKVLKVLKDKSSVALIN